MSPNNVDAIVRKAVQYQTNNTENTLLFRFKKMKEYGYTIKEFECLCSLFTYDEEAKHPVTLFGKKVTHPTLIELIILSNSFYSADEVDLLLSTL